MNILIEKKNQKLGMTNGGISLIYGNCFIFGIGHRHKLCNMYICIKIRYFLCICIFLCNCVLFYTIAEFFAFAYFYVFLCIKQVGFFLLYTHKQKGRG